MAGETTTTTTAAPGTTAGGADTTTTTTTTKPWYEGADAEVLGNLQTHGWDKKTAAEAALAAAKSHMEAAKLIGGPPDKMLRIPEANDATGWKNFWAKLGTPADPKTGYDFKNIKFGDGSELTPEFQEQVRGIASKLNLRPTDAQSLAQELVKIMDAEDANSAASHTAEIAKQKTALEQNWGGPDTPQFKANMFVAQSAAQKLGIPKEAIDTLQNMEGVGYASVMEMFRKIGEATGEAKFITGGATGGVGGQTIMTVEQAVARQAALKSDSVWVQKYLSGDATAIQEMNALNIVIANSMTRKAA